MKNKILRGTGGFIWLTKLDKTKVLVNLDHVIMFDRPSAVGAKHRCVVCFWTSSILVMESLEDIFNYKMSQPHTGRFILLTYYPLALQVLVNIDHVTKFEPVVYALKRKKQVVNSVVNFMSFSIIVMESPQTISAILRAEYHDGTG
jgi:hypothetical protein